MSGQEPAKPETPVDPFDADQTPHLDDVFGFGHSVLAEPEEAGPAEPAVGAAEGDGEGEGKAPSPEPAEQQQEPPAPMDDRELELESLRAQLQAAKEKLEATPEPAPAQPEPTTPAAPEAPKAPDPVVVKLPDQMKEAIFGESLEDASAAMDQLVSHIFTQVNANFHTLISALPQLIEAEVKKITGGQPAAAPATPSATPAATPDVQQAQLEQARNEYFADFPHHNKPEVLPVIAAVAHEMATQFPGAKWDQRYRASLGARVTERLKALAALTNPSSPAPSLPFGSRSADPAPGDVDISAEILDTLRG